MTHLIFVGYKTAVVSGFEELMPTFEGRAGTKDPEKIAEQIAEKKNAWLQDAPNSPYTGTLSEVVLAVPSLGKMVTFKAEGRGPGTAKPAVCVAARNIILEWFPDEWPNETHPVYSKVNVAICGFATRTFIKMLGIECSLPQNKCPLPPPLWYSNSDHRDIGEAVMPTGFTVGWPTVIKARRVGLSAVDLEKYNKTFEGWDGPGNNCEQDVKVALLMADQLGFIAAPPAEKPKARK